GFAGLPACLGGEIFGGVCLGAAGLAGIVERRSVAHRELRCGELGPALRQRVLHALVLADRPAEDDALLGVRRGASERDEAQADRLGGDQDAFGVHAVQNQAETLTFL